MEKIHISGFADEICPDFSQQLAVVKRLGMAYISLRTANGKSIADYTVQEAKEVLLPALQAQGIAVSSLGSPIGKVNIDDEDGFEKQLVQLEALCEICKVLSCRYIRMFSFFMPHGQDPAQYKDAVIAKLKRFAAIACTHDMILIHENEKEIYGDTAARCKEIFDAVGSAHFKAAFDYANFVQCAQDTATAWELLKDEVVYIHIKDAVVGNNENVLCGTGDGKIEPLLALALQNGYEGFLTLEPHLFLFDALQSLETADAKNIIKENKAQSGEEAYEMQYNALQEILNRMDATNR